MLRPVALSATVTSSCCGSGRRCPTRIAELDGRLPAAGPGADRLAGQGRHRRVGEVAAAGAVLAAGRRARRSLQPQAPDDRLRRAAAAGSGEHRRCAGARPPRVRADRGSSPSSTAACSPPPTSPSAARCATSSKPSSCRTPSRATRAAPTPPALIGPSLGGAAVLDRARAAIRRRRGARSCARRLRSRRRGPVSRCGPIRRPAAVARAARPRCSRASRWMRASPSTARPRCCLRSATRCSRASSC